MSPLEETIEQLTLGASGAAAVFCVHGLTNNNYLEFAASGVLSYFLARRVFSRKPTREENREAKAILRQRYAKHLAVINYFSKK